MNQKEKEYALEILDLYLCDVMNKIQICKREYRYGTYEFIKRKQILKKIKNIIEDVEV